MPHEKRIVILTEEQKEKIRELFNTLPKEQLGVVNIARIVFNDPNIVNTRVEVAVVKKYLAEVQFDYKKSNREVEPKGLLELTEEQKKKVEANLAAYIKKDIPSLELTRLIFENDALGSLSQEYRSMMAYLNEAINKMDSDTFKQLSIISSSEDLARRDYQPPKTIVQVLARINKYVVGEDWKEPTIKSDQRKKAESLLKYLNTYRVKYEINSYPKESQREVFEDAFVRYTYNKIDLEAEHLDQYVSLSAERVNEVNIKQQINIMTQALEAQNGDTEGRKIAMGLVEAISSARTELNQCMIRQDKLYKGLTTQRSKELESKKAENATMLNLVIPWRQADFRKQTIHLAIKEKEKLRDEVKKLSSIGEIKAMLRGLSKEEVDSSFSDIDDFNEKI